MILLELTPIARFSPTPDWVLYTLLGCLGMICLGKLLFTAKFRSLTNRVEYMSFADESPVIFSVLIYFLALVLSALMVVDYFGNLTNTGFDEPFTKFILVFGLIGGVMFLKTLLELAYFNAFYAEVDLKNFFGDASFINARNVLGLLILAFLFFYSPINKTYILIAGAILLVFNRLWELYYRYFTAKNDFSQNWYHNILYLCTLEILPIMVLIKIILLGKVI